MDGSGKGLRYKLTIKGTVQGVGFRPFIYNLATDLNIRGYVTNTSSGVEIEAEGENSHIFIEKIEREHPHLSKIISIDVETLPPVNYSNFEIKKSVTNKRHLTFIPPDTALCINCRNELYDKNDRHYHYPFTNCTNCGPRYSITKTIPYDRKNTTMAPFKMCPDCEREYNDPRDRRFHAQPNACPRCGPHLELRVNVGAGFALPDSLQKNPIEETIRLLKQGAIIAIKGIGGFHIACDAENETAVEMLRRRKRRGNKPFAIMCPDIGTAGSFGKIDDNTRSLLFSHESPVVLIKKKNNTTLSCSVSPNNPYYGVMMPYTPLHDLLFFYPDGKKPNFNALIMTSGNISEEPIIKDNAEAIEKLKDICDAFLIHDREIQTRVDDSVVNPPCPPLVKGGEGGITFIRRSRGYAPNPIKLPFDVPPLLACGAELKSTVTIAKERSAIVSQHLGDMESYETLNLFEETLSNLKTVFNIEPEFIFYDMHPDYIITRWAIEKGMKGFAIQHHEAHIASCIAENGLEGDVIGIALDGTGYGRDGNIWGGEIFTGNLSNFKRVCHLRYIPMPGGEMAIKEPWRMAVSSLLHTSGENINYIIERWGTLGAENIIEMMNKKVNSPLTSSCGRLFDAAASIIADFNWTSFEAEAAIGLEALAFNSPEETGRYSYDIVMENRVGRPDSTQMGSDRSPDLYITSLENNPPSPPFRKGGMGGFDKVFLDEMIIIDFKNTFNELLEDIRKEKDKRTIASLFHNTIASAITDAVIKISEPSVINNICLSGGVFQNKVFTEILIKKLSDLDFNVFTHLLLPPNDGCISFGQAAIGGWRVR